MPRGVASDFGLLRLYTRLNDKGKGEGGREGGGEGNCAEKASKYFSSRENERVPICYIERAREVDCRLLYSAALMSRFGSSRSVGSTKSIE